MLSEVPEGWGHCVVSDVADVIMGQSPRSADVNESGFGLPFLQGCAEFGTKHPRYRAWVETPIKEALPKDILFSVRAPVGKQNIARDRVCIGRGLCAIRCRAIEQEFLSALLQHQVGFLLSQAQGSTFQAINKSQIESLLLIVPPPPEQKRIAEILSSVDESIQATQSVIDQAERVKRGLMEDLLTGGLGSEAIARGEVPEGWGSKVLSELACVKGGKRMPKGASFSDEVTQYPYIRVSDFRDGSVSMKNLCFVKPDDQVSIRKYTIGKDDLYISVAGTLGIVGEVPLELDGAQLTENAAKISIHDQEIINKKFLCFILKSNVGKHQIYNAQGVGGGVPKLALFRILDFVVPLPPLPEQKRIAAILSSVDEFIQSQKQIIDQYQVTKKGLMDDLLTGRVRTV